MNDDTRHFPQVVREYGPDDERKASIACAASITAIVLLIIANITPLAIEKWQAIFAAPQAVPSSSSSRTQPAVAASYVPCPKLRNGAWLRSEIAHGRKDGWVITCSYWGQELMTRDEVTL